MSFFSHIFSSAFVLQKAKWRAGDVFVTAGLLAVAFCVSLLSPLHCFSTRLPSADCAVFLSIGQGILEGKTPYVDFFDHKGPLLYCINALGLFVGGERGVWFLEFFFLFVSACFAYKTARIRLGRFSAFFTTGAFFSLLGVYFDSGNIPEEYALPLMFISLYIYARFFFKSDSNEVAGGGLKSREMFILGACFGGSLLLKANLFAIWAVFTAVIFIREVLRKNYAFVFRYTLWFFVGTAFAILPFVVYFVAKGAFSEFLYQNFTFNFKYASQARTLALYLRNLELAMGNAANAAVFVVFSFLSLLREGKSERFPFYAAVFLSIIASLLMILGTPWLGLRNQLILFPLFSIVFPFYPISFPRFLGKWSRIFPIFFFILLFSFPLYEGLKTARGIMRPAGVETHGFTRRKMERVCSAVAGNVRTGETVTTLGNNCSMYFYTGLVSFSASKYIYQLPTGEIDGRIAREYEADILARKPKLIFVAWPYVERLPGSEEDMVAVRRLFPRIASLLETEYAKLHVEKGLAVVFERR
ncbi:MAG: hypothetical protein LBS59_04870 [Puniceicoccales bacterium]|jgi:hypothetical protein|nr:hypothetical protein [Puniceicoccales bacterium]